MSTTLPSYFSKTQRIAVSRWLLRQLLIFVVISLSISVALVIIFDQRVAPTLIYCFSITFCCAFFCQALRYGSALLVQRFGLVAEVPGEHFWPGWPLMIFSLVAGTAIGYSAGTEIGNWFTGFSEAGLHNTTLRRGLTIMMVSLIPGLGLTFYFVGRGRLDAAEARAQTAQRQAAENQLRLLESQLEPHMLFNTLANLRVLIGMDPARAQQMLDQLIAFLRATLTASRTGSHSLREEFARLADYLALMQIRMGPRLRPQLDLPAELAELAIPPLLLQPLVENAIKHGLEPNIDGGELRISARRTAEGQLLLEVLDTGVGLAAARASEGTPPGTHFGLHQVRERLTTRYGPAATLTISPAPGTGTQVRIQLPIP